MIVKTFIFLVHSVIWKSELWTNRSLKTTSLWSTSDFNKIASGGATCIKVVVAIMERLLDKSSQDGVRRIPTDNTLHLPIYNVCNFLNLSAIQFQHSLYLIMIFLTWLDMLCCVVLLFLGGGM